MSHFTYIKTSFQNLFYLEKALNRLNIKYQQSNDNNNFPTNLIIPQSNGYDVKFAWNGEKYDLIIDMSFWKQSSSIQNFVNKLSQQYAGEVIIGESQKIGFQPTQHKQNSDGSNTLILERWNS